MGARRRSSLITLGLLGRCARSLRPDAPEDVMCLSLDWITKHLVRDINFCLRGVRSAPVWMGSQTRLSPRGLDLAGSCVGRNFQDQIAVKLPVLVVCHPKKGSPTKDRCVAKVLA